MMVLKIPLTETNKTLYFSMFLKQIKTKIELDEIFSKYLDLTLFETFFQMILSFDIRASKLTLYSYLNVFFLA